MKLIKHAFDAVYFENFAYRETENSQRNHERLRALMDYKQGGRLLEIGCGKAGFLRLAEEHFHVEGVDVSSYAIQAIRKHFGSRVWLSNIEHQSLPAMKYDAIAVFNILEHLRNPSEVVDRLHSSLNGSGVMIGSVPNNFGIVGKFITRLGNFFDRTHISTLPPVNWRHIFYEAGFQQVDFFGEVTVGRNYCRYIRSGLWPNVSFNLMFVCQK